MKKFVGIVNGKEFNNEKDFNKAADEAINKNEGTLSITSYTRYVNDEEEDELKEADKNQQKLLEAKQEDKPVDEKPVEKSEKEEDTGDGISEDEYVIANQKPKYSLYGGCVYPVSNNLYARIYNLGKEDKASVVKKCNEINESLDDDIKKGEDALVSLEAKIEKLQNELYEKEGIVKEMKARKDYYDNIKDIIKKSDDAESRKAEYKKKLASKKYNLEDYSLFDLLSDLGFINRF